MTENPENDRSDLLRDEPLGDDEPTLERSERDLWQSDHRPRRWPWVVLVVVLAAVLFYFYYLTKEPPATEAAPERAAQPATTEPADTREEPTVDLPPLDASDDFVRQELAQLSADSQFQQWLQGDDLARRFVLAVLAVAEGRSPQKQWPALAPDEPFTPNMVNGRALLGENSWQRFDGAVAVIDSIDTSAAASIARLITPLLDAAWHQLGFQGRSFASGVGRALTRLRQAPHPEGPIYLEQGAVGWRFVDPKLESLRPIQKLLLRMGPRNRERLIDKIEAIAAEAGFLNTGP